MIKADASVIAPAVTNTGADKCKCWYSPNTTPAMAPKRPKPEHIPIPINLQKESINSRIGAQSKIPRGPKKSYKSCQNDVRQIFEIFPSNHNIIKPFFRQCCDLTEKFAAHCFDRIFFNFSFPDIPKKKLML